MSLVDRFELILALLAATVALDRVAKALRIPPAAALLVGGLILALIPGLPEIAIDPDLTLVLFLPPLLVAGAFFTAWRDFRADLRIILQLAIGAVLFTTAAVGLVAHLMVPGLPWAACFALGAIVSPPDAVAAKAVLHGLPLPARVVTLLEGESLVNDASGLVLYRFAVAAALTGVFDAGDAALQFGILSVGGVAAGIVTGTAATLLIPRLKQPELQTVTSLLVAWATYIGAERLGVSGVLAAVACGLRLGWRQHNVLTAATRLQAKAFWDVLVFVLESMVFILIGLSLRGVAQRLAEADGRALLPAIAAIVAAVIVSRFLWIFPATYLPRALFAPLRRRDPHPRLAIPLVMSWAGMRGVVSLAAALALPEGFPGRDLILATTFTVILVTVLLQGATLAPLIRALNLGAFQSRGLDDDAVELVAAAHQAADDADQVAAHRAADAAVVHLEHLLVAVHDEVVVDAEFAELVDDDRVFLAVVLAQDPVEQRGLAGAEVAGQHGDGDLGVGHRENSVVRRLI